MLRRVPYTAPVWARDLVQPPGGRVQLANIPTPLHRWSLPNVPDDVELWIKRDDLTGMQLSGNKVRKLEFLLADALAKGSDCVVTAGGIQSNHCRATAVAARYLGLDCNLILRCAESDLAKEDIGTTGNLMVDRMVGADITKVSQAEYSEQGGDALIARTCQKLAAAGHRPYGIRVGGSDSLGLWGYLNAASELAAQTAAGEAPQFDVVVLATGSGGTLGGMALGTARAPELKDTKVLAYSVCDSPQFFHEECQALLQGLGAGEQTKDLFEVKDAMGLGYAESTDAELEFIRSVARTTGVILDPVYTGKGAYGFAQTVASNPSAWSGKKVLFIHTGGLLGTYAKAEELVNASKL